MFHTICPVYTYRKNNFCYNNPINEVVIAVFPSWNETDNQLYWLFTAEHTTTISQDVMSQLQV